MTQSTTYDVEALSPVSVTAAVLFTAQAAVPCKTTVDAFAVDAWYTALATAAQDTSPEGLDCVTTTTRVLVGDLMEGATDIDSINGAAPTLVGMYEGCPVGWDDGYRDGCADGCAEGKSEGCDDGCLEGLAVGCRDGRDKGCPLGCRVGWPEGFFDGLEVGCLVGWRVGCIDG